MNKCRDWSDRLDRGGDQSIPNVGFVCDLRYSAHSMMSMTSRKMLGVAMKGERSVDDSKWEK